MFIIAVGHGFALGTVFSTFEAAQTAADRLNLRSYEIVDQNPEPDTMNEDEALAELERMLTSTIRDGDQTSYKLAKEREEYKKDPSPDTLAIIQRTERKLEANRKREAVLKFCMSKMIE